MLNFKEVVMADKTEMPWTKGVQSGDKAGSIPPLGTILSGVIQPMWKVNIRFMCMPNR